MTNCVTEMMQTAGVELLKTIVYPTRIDMYKEINSKIIYVYPDFTAEKQLELIKLIISKTDLHIDGWGMSSLAEEYDVIEVENDDFTQALAQLTTELMKSGELDKEKVKEILQ